MVKKHFSAMIALCVLFSGTLCGAESPGIGVVNFATCFSESKFGKKEQENFENLRKQMTSLVETTEKELKELSAKLDDPDYLESLSPKAEEELKTKYQERQEEMNRYQNQFYQMLQHANYQMIQKVNGNIAAAAEKVAAQKQLNYVINREMCFYISSDLDVTTTIISEMDKMFDVENAKTDKDVSDHLDAVPSLDEGSPAQAG